LLLTISLFFPKKHPAKSILPTYEPILRLTIRSSEERVANERGDYKQANAGKKKIGELAQYFLQCAIRREFILM
jgi:hypothetical protein